MAIEITHVGKTGHCEPYNAIDRIGGTHPDGKQWRLSQQDAIGVIERKELSFYIRAGGRIARVVLAEHAGHKYIKTENDGVNPDDLLALPGCR